MIWNVLVWIGMAFCVLGLFAMLLPDNPNKEPLGRTGKTVVNLLSVLLLISWLLLSGRFLGLW